MNFKQLFIDTVYGKQQPIDNLMAKAMTNKEVCHLCVKQHTYNCPNSAMCYSLDDKPHFEQR